MNSTESILMDYHITLQNALADCEIDEDSRGKLLRLAKDEAEAAFDAAPAHDFTSSESVPQSLGKLAKLVRLSGAMPLYLAKITALYFAKGDADESGIREQVKNKCEMRFEREFVQLVAEAFRDLPDLKLDDVSVSESALIKDVYRKGYAYEKTHRGCAQCTVAAVSDITERKDDGIFRAAGGFAGGMAQLGDGACGGYSGGLLSMGMFAGRRREFFDGDKAEKDLNALLAQKLHAKFIETYGTVICHGIHNQIFGRAFHITKAGDKEAFEEAGAHSLDKCPAVVGTAAAWTTQLLLEHGLLTAKL